MDQIRVLFWNEYLRTCMCSLLSMGVGLRINVTLMKPKRNLRPLIIYLIFVSGESGQRADKRIR